MYNEEKQMIFVSVRVGGNYGDDDTPDATATNAMMASNIGHKPLEGSRISRDVIKGFLGATGELQISSYVELSFDVELSGSGDKVLPPAYSSLYHLCGVSEKLTALTSVDYALVDSGYKDGTIYYYVDGVLHKMLGARGFFSFTLGTGGIPKLSFTFMGLYVEPSAVGALPVADFSAFKMPKPATSSTLSVFNFFGQPLLMSELSVTPGMSVSHLDVANQEEIEFSGTRAGSISLKFRAPAFGTINFFALKQSGAKGALNYQLGTDVDDDGFIFDLNIPVLDVKNVTRSFSEGKSWLQVESDITPTAANNDLNWQHR